MLIDYSKSSEATVLEVFHPELETVYQLNGGVSDVTVNFVASLTASLLQNVDLLVIMVVDTGRIGTMAPNCDGLPQFYSQSELDDIAQWMAVPGRRLVVISDAHCSLTLPNLNHLVANPILQAVGSTSLFDDSFPPGEIQEDTYYHTLKIFPDPPITDGIGALFSWVPGSVSPGLGASVVAEADVCLIFETGITTPSPFGGEVVESCLSGEEIFDTFTGNYIVSETLPVSNPDPTVEITAVNGVSVPAGPGGLLLLDPANGQLLNPPTTVSVDGTFANIAPTAVTVNGMAASVNGNNFSVMLPSFLGPEHEARGIFVEALNDQGPEVIEAADTLVIRAKRQSARTRFVTFLNDTGIPAIGSSALVASIRQAGLELHEMCRASNPGVVADAGRPGFEPRFVPVGSSAVQVVGAFDMPILDPANPQFGLTSQAENLLEGILPDGDEDVGNLIPDSFVGPGPGGSGPPFDIRIFVHGAFSEMVATAAGPQEFVLAQNTEAGRSLNAFSIVGQDVVFAQVSLGDTEAGALAVDRPVVNGLVHELLHVSVGSSDNPAEDAVGARPVALPTGMASSMNSFPFFRSLNPGGAALTHCAGGNLSSVEDFCERALEGFSCFTDFDFTD